VRPDEIPQIYITERCPRSRAIR